MHRKQILRASIFTMALLVAVGIWPMQAQLKVGYMNPQTVMDTLPAKQQVEKQLSDFIEKRRSQLEQQTVRFQKRISTIQQQAQNAGEDRKKQLQDSANSINQRLTKYRQNIQRQIQKKRAQLLRPIYNRIDRAIQTVAEQKNLEFVLNERTSNGQDIIYYADARQLNITEEVIDKLLQENNGN